MTVMYIENEIGYDVDIIANYGDGGVLIEFHDGKRKLVSRDQIDFNYFEAENHTTESIQRTIDQTVPPKEEPAEVVNMANQLKRYSESSIKHSEEIQALKQTVESLNEQLETKSRTIKGQLTIIQALEDENTRYKKIIDFIARQGNFEN